MFIENNKGMVKNHAQNIKSNHIWKLWIAMRMSDMGGW
jgi:hypothetical protein